MKRILALVFLGLAINWSVISAAQAHEHGDRRWYGGHEVGEDGGWVVGAVILGGILGAMAAQQAPVYVRPAPLVVQPPTVVVPQPTYIYPAQPTYVYPAAPTYVQPAYTVPYPYGARDDDDD